MIATAPKVIDSHNLNTHGISLLLLVVTPYIHTYIRTYIHTYIHTFYTYSGRYFNDCAHCICYIVCMYVYMYVCIQVSVLHTVPIYLYTTSGSMIIIDMVYVYAVTCMYRIRCPEQPGRTWRCRA